MRLLDDVDLSQLALVALDDDAAMEELMARVCDVSHRYCRARLTSYAGGRQLSDDVVQEICLAVFKALPRFRHTGVPFEAFVYSIGSRKVADAQRGAIRSPLVLVADVPDEADPALSPEQNAIRASESAEMLHLLDRLPDKLREVLVLRVAMALTAERVGVALGMSAGAVRVSQHRGLERLRVLMRERNQTLQAVKQ